MYQDWNGYLSTADKATADGTPGLVTANRTAYGKCQPVNRKVRRLVKQFAAMSRQLNALPWYAADKRKAIAKAMNRLVYRMAIAIHDHEARPDHDRREYCAGCGHHVVPVLHSIGHQWIALDGSAEDDFEEQYRCPMCGAEIDVPEVSRTPVEIDVDF